MSKKLRILFLWPPEMPYDLTLHHHYTILGETAAYFFGKPEYQVDIFDGGALTYLKKEYIQKLLNCYDYLIILSYVHNTHSAIRAARICKDITPNTKIVAYGPSCYYVPQFFGKPIFDAYIWAGDPESGIESFIKYNEKLIDKQELSGVVINSNGYKAKPKYLEPDLWAFPPLKELPLDEYDRIVSKKKTIRKFGKRQISLTVSRGCPYNCDFCFATPMYGRKERRRPVDKIIKYIKENKKHFMTIQMFSPNFTYDKKWVREFCQKLIKENIKISWRCTTRIALLDEEIVKIMAEAGCKSVGIGVESLQEDIQQEIHKVQSTHQVIKTIKMLNKVGINAKGYIMLGLPGQTKEDILKTIKIITNAGGEVRPSSYSPYHLLTKRSTLSEVSAMNRYTYKIDSVEGLTSVEYLKIIFNRDFTISED